MTDATTPHTYHNDLSVDFCGIRLRNPVVTASGTVGFGRVYNEFFKPSDVGAVTVKGLTLLPQQGNEPPRIAETPSGMLNSIGLQNPGVDAFLGRELRRLKSYGAVVIANVAGHTIDEYCEVAQRISHSETDMVELNISCPNVDCGGMAFGTDPAMAGRVTSAVRARCAKPLIVKLSPNVTDIAEIARAAQAAGADAISLINTLQGMAIDIRTRRPVLRRNVGGLSGPAVKPVAVRMVWEVRRATDLPIIGMGGVASAEDALEFILAGASCVGVGAALFNEPRTPLTVLEGIDRYMSEYGVKSVAELVGAVQPW